MCACHAIQFSIIHLKWWKRANQQHQKQEKDTEKARLKKIFYCESIRSSFCRRTSVAIQIQWRLFVRWRAKSKKNTNKTFCRSVWNAKWEHQKVYTHTNIYEQQRKTSKTEKKEIKEDSEKNFPTEEKQLRGRTEFERKRKTENVRRSFSKNGKFCNRI